MVETQPEILAIFTEAVRLESPAQRSRYLDEACGSDSVARRRIETLLKAHFEAGKFLGEYFPDATTTGNSELAEGPGSHIGPYKLLEQIGEGGMGVVYVAEQTEPVRRRVALKVIKPGMDTKQVIARFEAERQALAMMDHPNIAKVLDAGTTDASRPYFVMELVRGMPITEYCDKAKLNPRQRLELFVDVSHAVQHAHQKGVIHRDLKPSNILITLNDGTPLVKVIDFGVAKAIGQQLTDRTVYTALTQLVGTPLYMSPEQAEMSNLDVDTRSDVYSPGVLLYELLTGTTPFDKDRLKSAGLDEMRRIIREDEPLPPSRRLSTLGAAAISTASQHRGLDERRLNKLLSGELDWIVMRALEKDRSRRYESASALAADIQRYLSDEPVLACPPTTMYRFQKFARKHKPALVTAAAIVACLVLGTTVSAWQAARAITAEAQATVNEKTASANAAKAEEKAREATEQRDEAQKQRDEVRALNDKLQRTLYAADMKLAKVAWDEAAVHQTEQLLEQHRPKLGEQDLRGFEWHYLDRLCHSELLTFKGHGGWVQSVAFSPDGKRVASVGNNDANKERNIKVWDSKSGQELLTIKGGGWSLAFNTNGKHIAGSSRDNTVRVWDSYTGAEVFNLKGHTGEVDSLAYSPDGKWLCSAATGYNEKQNRIEPAELKLWDAQTGELVRTTSGVYGVCAFSPDGRRLVSGNDKEMKVWDVQTGDELLVVPGAVRSVAFSPDGKRIAKARGVEVTINDAQTGQQLLFFKAGGRHVVFSPDGKCLATSGGDRTIKIWDSATGQHLYSLKGHANVVNRVAFNVDGTRLASSSLDGTVRIWNAGAGPESRLFSQPTARTRNMAFSPDGMTLAAAVKETMTTDYAVKVWNVRTGEELLNIRGNKDEAFGRVAFSPDGKWLAGGIGIWDNDKNDFVRGNVKLWDARTGKELLAFGTYESMVRAVAISPDGMLVATTGRSVSDAAKQASSAGEIKLWDAKTGQERMTLRAHVGPINSLAFSPGGQLLASHSGEGNIKVWNIESGDAILTIAISTPSQPGSLTFSPDGKRLAGSCRAPISGIGPAATGEVKVWDARTGDEIFTLKGHTAAVSSVVYSRDGKRLASASGSAVGPDDLGEIKIWDAETGQELLTLKGGSFGTHVAFSPDGQLLASDAGGPIRIYDATPLPEKP